jgi:hypothetical protein
MKNSSVIILVASLLCISCTPIWVRELEIENMFKDSANIISIYFRFDTIIHDFEVSGILYPNYSEEYGWSSGNIRKHVAEWRKWRKLLRHSATSATSAMLSN